MEEIEHKKASLILLVICNDWTLNMGEAVGGVIGKLGKTTIQNWFKYGTHSDVSFRSILVTQRTHWILHPLSPPS